MEHRGACAADGTTGDGAGVMTDIPWTVLGYDPGAIAIATLFVASDDARRTRALKAFEETCSFLRVPVVEYREVPTNPEVLGPLARQSAPKIIQAVLSRPEHSRTDAAFDGLLYQCKQLTRVRLLEIGAWHDLFFTSLSTSTIVYKALCRSAVLDQFYPDLGNPRYTTRFCLFHRRFSTNTRTSWDKAQPFRVLGHNGEINTVTGNRSAAFSREHAMGLSAGELLTHAEISDSGSLGEIVEALKHRSALPHLDEILAITIPPAESQAPFYRFWGRAMEPWDGPALIAFSDGDTVGARLDRNGFRPARWCMTDDVVALASEAGVFGLDEADIRGKGTLAAGTGVSVRLDSGRVHFRDPGNSRENWGAKFEARLVGIDAVPDFLERGVVEQAQLEPSPESLDRVALFGLTTEEVDRQLLPMIISGKEPIGSMGDTARPAVFSDVQRSFYDFFVQRFAQVTNPPLDYLREGLVTDLRTFIGARPNIFVPKELIPVAPGIVLEHPILTLRQMQVVSLLTLRRPTRLRTLARVLDCTYEARLGATGLSLALEALAVAAVDATRDGISILIVSDRAASRERIAAPSLLALRAVVCALNEVGARVHTSVVLEAGDVRTTHQIACAVSFGASAVCPYLALEFARFSDHPKLAGGEGSANEQRLITALRSGLLKAMSKMGISVVRSYQSSKLFAAYGLGPKLMADYFDGVSSPLGGYELHDLGLQLCRQLAELADVPLDEPRPSTYQLKERNKGGGERHAMTAARSKLVHDLVRGRLQGRTEQEIEDAYLAQGRDAAPVSPRHLLSLRAAETPLALEDVCSDADVLARFGSGAMSFGAISAEVQRDLFVAMRSVGGRCNSGEGGENPFYFLDGTTASTKQVASGRFGVNAEYLIHADEIEIKIAQGAKPGEGGQLMGVKVDAAIAAARNCGVGVDLISPPPLHDLYSIEDLKQLIYELKQLKPGVAVCVKLVAGAGIGTIAAGVVKSGADVVQISGADGGTGAATVSSMKHAGWAWELGLVEVHRTLVDHGLRSAVRLRVDGGLSSGEDVVIAAALGADEFGFGKILLIAQGCIMARVCEKNRCPTGIATQDPKFKAKYKGSAEHVRRMLQLLSSQVRQCLAQIGVRGLDEVVGRRRFLAARPDLRKLVERRRLDLSPLLEPIAYDVASFVAAPEQPRSRLNQQILDAVLPRLEAGERAEVELAICSRDRAVGAALAGVLAERSHRARMAALDGATPNRQNYYPEPDTIELTLRGTAGQGFCAFAGPGLSVRLMGSANDSVAKSMCGGSIVIVPAEAATFDPRENTIVGNGALYGATGGRLLVYGRAGDRFAVRNSGADAVVEGAGLHACEYMTGGVVAVLGSVGRNAGAGMTGGVLWLSRSQLTQLNTSYVAEVEPDAAEVEAFRALLVAYFGATGSPTAGEVLDRADAIAREFAMVAPRRG